jgi:hypothetical protein
MSTQNNATTYDRSARRPWLSVAVAETLNANENDSFAHFDDDVDLGRHDCCFDRHRRRVISQVTENVTRVDLTIAWCWKVNVNELDPCCNLDFPLSARAKKAAQEVDTDQI